MTGRGLDPTLLRLLGSVEPKIGVPALRAHLAGRPACAEEHASLRRLLELDSVS
jgi:hypothetical protein